MLNLMAKVLFLYDPPGFLERVNESLGQPFFFTLFSGGFFSCQKIVIVLFEGRRNIFGHCVDANRGHFNNISQQCSAGCSKRIVCFSFSQKIISEKNLAVGPGKVKKKKNPREIQIRFRRPSTSPRRKTVKTLIRRSKNMSILLQRGTHTFFSGVGLLLLFCFSNVPLSVERPLFIKKNSYF